MNFKVLQEAQNHVLVSAINQICNFACVCVGMCICHCKCLMASTA